MNLAQIKLANYINDKIGQIPLRQPILHRRRK
jgi:hypothetical protein